MGRERRQRDCARISTRDSARLYSDISRSTVGWCCMSIPITHAPTSAQELTIRAVTTPEHSVLAPMPMTPAEVADLVRRTRLAMEAADTSVRKNSWSYRTPPGLQAARYALEYGLTASDSAQRCGLITQTVQRHMRRLRRAS